MEISPQFPYLISSLVFLGKWKTFRDTEKKIRTIFQIIVEKYEV